jgi:hypothetical protein
MAVITSPEPLPKSLVEIVIKQATSYQVWDYLTMHTFHYIKFFLYLNIKSVPVPQSALTLPLLEAYPCHVNEPPFSTLQKK